MQKLLMKDKLDFSSIKPPDNYFKKIIYNFTKSKYFEIFIMLCIVSNILTMALSYDESSTKFDTVNFFILIFY